MSWFIPVSLRASVIGKIPGGFPRVLRAFLRRILIGPNGLETAGFALDLDLDRPFLPNARLTDLLLDGEGLQRGLDWRGAGSLRPCLKHCNVLMKDSSLVRRDATNSYVEITCNQPERFQRIGANDWGIACDSLCEAERRVAAGTMTRVRFEQLGMALGMQPNPLGLLADTELRQHFDLVQVVDYDWMHSCLQDGTLSVELYLFLQACSRIGVASSDFEAYLKTDWCFPRRTASKSKELHRVFNEYRSRSSDRADKLKCTASELLSVYGLVRQYVETRIPERADLAAERKSFFAACTVVDLVLLAKRGTADMRTAGGRVREALSFHLACHIETYGTGWIKPKHHWMYDVCDQMERTDRPTFMADAFIVERLHLRVKPFAERTDNLKSFERSILRCTLNAQIDSLQKQGIGSGLVGKSARCPGAPSILIADSMQILGRHFAVKDVVFHGDIAGEISACALEDGELFVIVSAMRFDRTVHPLFVFLGGAVEMGPRWAHAWAPMDGPMDGPSLGPPCMGPKPLPPSHYEGISVSTHSSTCLPTAELQIWQAVMIEMSLAWRHDDDGLLIVRM